MKYVVQVKIHTGKWGESSEGQGYWLDFDFDDHSREVAEGFAASVSMADNVCQTIGPKVMK